MAIDFGPFRYASAPRTATTWIKQASAVAGLIGGGSVHVPHDDDQSKIRLSSVRHPADWLRSYWTAIWPSQIQIDLVDGLRKTCDGAASFDDFVRLYLRGCWGIGNMHEGYGADVVIRVEDLPWAFVEFLDSVGVEKRARERCLLIGRPNVSSELPKMSPLLRDRIIEAEWPMVEKYDYDLIP